MTYRSSPSGSIGMPPGILHIVGNEAAERFSFYGMKAVLAVFMVQYLHLMDGRPGSPMSEAEAAEKVHLFTGAVYLTPLLGALLADIFIGKYRTIIALSVVYCLGHAALAFMGLAGHSASWLAAGLGLIALGSGGIKPCVSAHVGDQFGAQNAHLLPKVFNWFYFAINFGAFVSMLLTPWLLEWHGPHWAFGVPGVLMLLATIVFHAGRNRFVHVPPAGKAFFRELLGGEGLRAIGKLLPMYLFVAMFWALFDQTGSTWIFQAEDMDRRFLGMEWLPSQVQALNSVFVLTFIPLFAYLVYPLGDRVWRLSPLRKIGLGFFIMTGAFALVTLVQGWIDAGQRPNIGWQILAYALLTIAEVMVSIVSLEYAYTQAPRRLKSLVMCLYLCAVALGNFLVAAVNHQIRVPDAAAEQLASQLGETLPADMHKDPRQVVLAGYDGITGTADDMVQRLREGTPIALEIPGMEIFREAARIVADRAAQAGGRLPSEPEATALLGELRDFWSNPLRYEILNSRQVRIVGNGPDRRSGTKWDCGVIMELPAPADADAPASAGFLRPAEPWLERRKREADAAEAAPADKQAATEPMLSAFCGGQTKLRGAAYFRFFTWLMLGTTLAFIPYALLYRPRTYLQE
jgi:POT family proton-dependent oligopeptide transporter